MGPGKRSGDLKTTKKHSRSIQKKDANSGMYFWIVLPFLRGFDFRKPKCALAEVVELWHNVLYRMLGVDPVFRICFRNYDRNLEAVLWAAGQEWSGGWRYCVFWCFLLYASCICCMFSRMERSTGECIMYCVLFAIRLFKYILSWTNWHSWRRNQLKSVTDPPWLQKSRPAPPGYNPNMCVIQLKWSANRAHWLPVLTSMFVLVLWIVLTAAWHLWPCWSWSWTAESCSWS